MRFVIEFAKIKQVLSFSQRIMPSALYIRYMPKVVTTVYL